MFYSVSAIGIGSPYLKDKVLLLPEKESTIYTITLQNTGPEVKVRINLNSEGDVARIVDGKEFYVLPQGSIDTSVSFNISAGNATPGKKFRVEYSMEPLSSEGMMSIGIRKGFDVKIVEKSGKLYLRHYLALTAILVLAIGIYIWKVRYEEKPKRKRR